MVISYSLHKKSPTELVLTDISGRKILALKQGEQKAGLHTIVLNAESIPSGLYIIRLESGSKTDIQKVMLIR